jgi:hypothetical protein
MRFVKAVLGCVFFIGIFIVLPWYVLKMVPPEFLTTLEPILGSAKYIQKALAIIGIILSILFTIRILVPRRNLLNLLAYLGSEFFFFYLFLFFISFGNPANLGREDKTIQLGSGGSATIMLDLRFFVLLVFIILIAKVVLLILGFQSARREVKKAN